LAELRATMEEAGPGAFQELVDAFAEYAAEKMTALQAAAAAGNGDGLRQAAHALKSSSGAMGAGQLAALCAAAEHAASQGNLATALESVSAIQAELLRVQAALTGA
jgi:HPt (histidine-containing phosphotransfer) domain-containing protein